MKTFVFIITGVAIGAWIVFFLRSGADISDETIRSNTRKANDQRSMVTASSLGFTEGGGRNSDANASTDRTLTHKETEISRSPSAPVPESKPEPESPEEAFDEHPSVVEENLSNDLENFPAVSESADIEYVKCQRASCEIRFLPHPEKGGALQKALFAFLRENKSYGQHFFFITASDDPKATIWKFSKEKL